RLERIEYPDGKFLSFTYDQSGRRKSSLDQLGHRLDYFYDDAGRLYSMTNEANALVVRYDYNPVGQISKKLLGTEMVTTYHYDPAGQLLHLTNRLANGTEISRFNYTYDTRGRRRTMVSSDGLW